jgi:hypothetical protein
MKKVAFITIVSILMFGAVNAQNEAVLLEKTYSDLGKILDFKASMMTVKNLSSNKSENKLVLEYKSFTSSEARYIELTKPQLAELITAMNTINSNYFNSSRKTNIEISAQAINGLEVGCIFEIAVDKAGSTAATKREKYYIETKDKYYEGKIVNSDQSGTFIWKEVPVTSANKEVIGKWIPFIRTNNITSKTTTNLSIDEFKSLSKFLEENIPKL